MDEKKQSKQFNYRVAYYTEQELYNPPTTRSVSKVHVKATSVQRALTAAFTELGLESKRDWHVVSVTPVLDQTEARRYQV